MIQVKNTTLSFQYSPVAEQYIVYADQTEIGRAVDLDGAIQIIRFWQGKNEYTSDFCDNGEQRKQRSSAAQKSQ